MYQTARPLLVLRISKLQEAKTAMKHNHHLKQVRQTSRRNSEPDEHGICR